MFSTQSETEIIMLARFYLSPTNAFNLLQSKVLLCAKELKSHPHVKRDIGNKATSQKTRWVKKAHYKERYFLCSCHYFICHVTVATHLLLNPFPNDKIKTLPNSKPLQITILNLM